MLTCVIVVLLIALPIIYFNISNEPLKSLLLGVISSVIASLIFHIFSEAVFNDKSQEIEELKYITKTLVEKETRGILSIQGRSEFETSFWVSLLKETNEKLVLSGRTLNRWLDSNTKKDFIENLKRILQNKGEVTLIIYKELLEENEKKEKENLRNFLTDNIFPLCIRKSKQGKQIQQKKDIKLTILEVDILPYLYTSNENRIIVAPYFKYVDNGNNIMFALKRDCKYGTAYSRDFQSIINNADKCSWLSDYIKKCKEEVKINEGNKKV